MYNDNKFSMGSGTIGLFMSVQLGTTCQELFVFCNLIIAIHFSSYTGIISVLFSMIQLYLLNLEPRFSNNKRFVCPSRSILCVTCQEIFIN
jgi:hypothetical protein